MSRAPFWTGPVSCRIPYHHCFLSQVNIDPYLVDEDHDGVLGMFMRRIDCLGGLKEPGASRQIYGERYDAENLIDRNISPFKFVI